MSYIISVFNQKGGVGKTTTVINLSAALGKMGKRILIIDLDPQGNTTSGLGVDKKKLKSSMYDILINQVNPGKFIINTSAENVYIIPSNVELAGAEIELTGIENREVILRKMISKLDEEFDYIFIDCPPSLGLLSINALVSSRSVIIPIQCEYYALEGVSQLMDTVSLIKRSLNPDLKIEGIVLNMFDGRTNLSIQVVDEVKKYFKDRVYTSIIPRNVRLAEAPSYGLSIIDYDKNSRGAEAYTDLGQEFLERIRGNY